jgi:hypothetical protein
MADQVTFPDGFRVFSPKETAPEYIKCDIVINVDQFTQFMRAAATDGEVRLTLKESRGGALYCQLNTWRPESAATAQNAPTQPRPAPPPPPFPTAQEPQRNEGNRAFNHPTYIHPGEQEPPDDNLPGLEPGDEDISSIPF